MEWKVILNSGEVISKKDVYNPKEKDPPFRKIARYVVRNELEVENIEIVNTRAGFSFLVFDYELGIEKPQRFMIETNERHKLNLSGGGKAELEAIYDLISYFSNGCRTYIKLDYENGSFSTFCRGNDKEDFYNNYYTRLKE